jgi:hypothetical protein
MKYILIISALLLSSLVKAQIINSSCSSFQPLPGEKYIISGWVKESNSQTKKTYTNGVLEINFYNHTNDFNPALPPITMYPSGKIIEGWQRIVGILSIPTEGSNMDEIKTIGISLSCLNAGTDCYFDDIRIFPFNGSMKSFVYDKDTQRLMAELDENNYATYYEYDQEGGLVRVKKETEKGVYTIQETRSKSKKEQ